VKTMDIPTSEIKFVSNRNLVPIVIITNNMGK
jgi:hypothetical protein